MSKEQFEKDKREARVAELIALNTLTSLTDRYTFVDVANDREYYYKGDIIATSREINVDLLIEVKNDSRIADTGRVLCEEKVYYKDRGYLDKGNMHCKSDVYAVVSQSERIIYIFDFHKLKEIYKSYGEYKELDHSDQITYCYLVDLCWCRSKGALLRKVKY